MGKFKDWILVTDAGNGHSTVHDGETGNSIETDNTVQAVSDAIRDLNKRDDK